MLRIGVEPRRLRRCDASSLMIGEMNGSPTGHLPPPPPGAPTAATAAARVEFTRRAAYEQRGEFPYRPSSPNAAAALSEGIRVGDYLLAIDGTPITPNASLDSLLAFKVGKRLVVRVSVNESGANSRMFRCAREAPRSRSRCCIARGSRNGAHSLQSSATVGWATCTCSIWAATR